MFYSETLLSKTGPLARVWLSANIERKLSKSSVLTSNIESSVNAIVEPGQAPLALRLSGQLLLGVVRIYSRKARYLLDDCNEAIFKIKMAFKSGNVDLPANQSSAVNPASLTLPDVLTELDLLAPGPDPSLLLTQPPDGDSSGLDPSLLDFGASQQLTSSMDRGRDTPFDEPRLEDDEGLELDLTPGPITPSRRRPQEIEVGRDARTPRSLLDDHDDTTLRAPLEEDDLDLDIGKDAPPPPRDSPNVGALPDINNDITMSGLDDGGLPPIDDFDQATAAHAAQRTRDSQSPLSVLSDNAERDLEQSVYRQRNSNIFEPDEESVHQAQRAKRRKVLQADRDTQIHNNQIRDQQNDRSKILKPASFLPKDPMLLALMEMQKNGGFVSNILGDGRSKGWAPELRGILSLEVIRGSGEKKRKRDSGVAGLQDEEEIDREATPRLNVDLNEDLETAEAGANEPAVPSVHDEASIHIPADEEGLPLVEDEELQLEAGQDFEDTTMPILHPADSGPVSLGTKHAVHLLRDRFGSGAAQSPSKRQKSSVLFQDLLPERTSTRADATKMFFEVLVLATKDAVKVEQAERDLGGPLRVRGKRGLWGSWAETEAGGEIAEQEQQEQQEQQAVEA